MKNLITSSPVVCGGRPHIAGTRISVEIIQDHVTAGYTIEQLKHVYPHLSVEQIRAAIKYPLIMIYLIRLLQSTF